VSQQLEEKTHAKAQRRKEDKAERRASQSPLCAFAPLREHFPCAADFSQGAKS